MRIYQNCQEAFSEIKRDLVEMGIRIHPQTYQDKYVGDNPEFDTMELQDYIYSIINPVVGDIPGVVQPYADEEWLDRCIGIGGVPLNPGSSWASRKDVWQQFMDKNGKFAYTYPERFAAYNQVREVIDVLKADPDSRQGFISVWRPSDVSRLGGISRVPCTLGYQVQIRRDRVNLTYLQRSCDFATHMANDVFFAIRLQEYLAEQLHREKGKFTHWVGSLHIFRKDGKGVF